jgi:drug/metabolite transporter (DMT)-like permease
MFAFIVATSILKTLNPYLRKNILLTLDSHEYLFLNTFIIALLALLFLFYKIFFTNHDIETMINKYKSLTLLQIVFALLIGIVTISSSFLIINLDKYYNTPLVNSLFLKIASSILLLVIGIIIFKERYNYIQILGVILAIIGICLIFCKDQTNKFKI